MSFAVQTPQRPLPGAYLRTPATSKYQSGPIGQPNFRTDGSMSIQNNAPSNNSQVSAQQSQQLQQSQQSTAPAARSGQESLKPIERAAKTINETLVQEARYPELDSYVGRKWPTP